MHRRYAVLALGLSLTLFGCGESITEVEAPGVDPTPAFAIFPQYVADVTTWPSTVIAQAVSPNATSSQNASWTPTLGSTPNGARFYPATRTVDDTIMSVRLDHWEWNTSSGSQNSDQDVIEINNYTGGLKLYYRINVNAPVGIGAISGPDHIPFTGTYNWSVSGTGGDNDSTWVYGWEKSTNGGSSWSPVCGTSSSCGLTFNTAHDNFILRATATNSGRSASTTKPVTVADPLVGELWAAVVGPDYISEPDTYVWSVNLGGGVSPYTYQWHIAWDTAPNTWIDRGTGTSMSQYVGEGDPWFFVRVTVISADSQNTGDSQSVQVSLCGEEWCNQ